MLVYGANASRPRKLVLLILFNEFAVNMSANNQQPLLQVAQISDSHLFAEQGQLHCGVDVLANFQRVLFSIAENDEIDCLVFTGDLTQDHSDASYQQFVDAFAKANITIPCFFLAGNHDEQALLNKFLVNKPFKHDKTISKHNWQIQLVNSKSDTPAGYFAQDEAVRLSKVINQSCHQLVMMHHHPVNVGYFIDRHGLENHATFWQCINKHKNIRAIACGHVHGAHYFPAQNIGEQRSYQSADVYTCPATSIQFDPDVNGVSALALGPAFRIFSLFEDGQLETEVVRLPC